MNYAAVAEKANRYVQKGQYDKAVGLWNEFIPNAGDNEAANALNNLGDLCARKKNMVAAIDHYLKASHAFEQAGFPLKAIATLKKTLKLDPDRTEVYIRLGDLNARRDMIGNAVEAYLHVCRLNVAEGEQEQALEMVQKICILDPVNTRHRLQIAAELFELGFTDQAITETVNAIDLFLEGGNLEEAERYCRHLLDLQPGCDAARERLERIAHWGEPQGGPGAPASGEDTPIDELFAALDQVGEGDDAPSGQATAAAPAPAPPAAEFDITLPGDDAGPQEEVPAQEAQAQEAQAEEEPAFGEVTFDVEPPTDGSDLTDLLEPNTPVGGMAEEAAAPAPPPMELDLGGAPEGPHADAAAPEAEAAPDDAPGDPAAEWTLEPPPGTEDVPAVADPAEGPDNDFMSISLDDVSAAAEEATEHIDLDGAAPEPDAQDDAAAPVVALEEDDGDMDLASLDLTARFREEQASEPEDSASARDDSPAGPTAPEAPTPEPPAPQAPPRAPAPAAGVFQLKEALTEAHFYEREGLTEEAVKLYRSILAHVPGHPDATARMKALGHPVPPASASPAAAPPVSGDAGGDEFSSFTAAIEDTIEKEVAGAWRQVGEEAQFDEILDAFRRGVEEEVSADDAETHYDLGLAYHEMGLTEEAIGEFQRAVRGATRFADATIMLARCFSEMGKQRLAVTRLREAVSQPDCTGDAWISLAYELASVLESTGETQEARRMYEEVYARDITYRDVAKRVANLG